jgi:hypothetical protein
MVDNSVKSRTIKGEYMAALKNISFSGWLPFLVFMSGFLFTVSGLNAPYIISAQATDDRHVAVSWRNNDVTTEEFILLRKTSGASFRFVDSVSGSSTTFLDSNLTPSTQYFYAVLAFGQGQVSDTSNIVSAATAPLVKRFGAPPVTVLWNPDRNVDSISLYDSSTIEKGYRLYRRTLPGTFSLVATHGDSSPAQKGWMSFKDSVVSPNTWYGYKVEVFNDSASLFSSDTTLYTYKEPVPSEAYAFGRISEFPVAPVGWSEKVGDSLYVVENDMSSPNAITVINIKDRLHPAFKGYLRSDSLPVPLQHSQIAAYIKFSITQNPPWARQLVSAKGFYFAVRGDSLLQYIAATQARINSIVFDPTSIIAQINDSVLLINGVVPGGASTVGYSGPYTCKFSQTRLDTLNSIQIGTGGGSWGTLSYLSGYQNQKAYFYSSQCPMGCMGHSIEFYHICDYSVNPLSPLHFQIKAPSFSNSSICLLDSFVSFRFSGYDDSLVLETFDIRSALSKPLSRFADMQFKGGSINNIIIDSANSQIMIVGTKSFAIYDYSKTIIPVKMQYKAVPVGMDRLILRRVQNGVLIKIDNSADRPECLSVFNVAGKMVKQLPASHCSQSPWLFWDTRDSFGTALSPGPYFLTLKYAGRAKTGRVFLMR